jgi:hypothetical protein
MRMQALVLVSLCALAGCNPSGAGATFPNLAEASYRAEGTIHGEGQSMPVVMIRSGAKVRMEMAGPIGQMAMINNPDSGENFVLVVNDGQTMVMRSAPVEYENPADAWNAEFASAARRTGACAVAGESGSEWTHEENGQTSTTCVTDDGIILRAAQNGETTWETTSVQRGPQSADLFAMPAGAPVMDLDALGAAVGSSAAAGQATPELCNTLRNAGAPADALAQAGC